MNSGVYKIENIHNGLIYVGSAAHDFTRRWWKHKSDLRLNKHRNQRLQKAFNKYGETSFRFEVLAKCPKEYVLKLEQYFIDTLKPFYNICQIAGSSLGVKRTDEYKEKIRLSRIGKKSSEQTKAKFRERMKGNTHTKGTKRNPEVVERVRQKQIGSKRSIETKAKMSLAGKGRKTSEESKQKMSESTLKYQYSIQNIQTGEVLQTKNLKQFTIEYHLHEGHLNDTFKGYCSSGRRCLQHKGFVMTQKNLLQ